MNKSQISTFLNVIDRFHYILLTFQTVDISYQNISESHMICVKLNLSSHNCFGVGFVLPCKPEKSELLPASGELWGTWKGGGRAARLKGSLQAARIRWQENKPGRWLEEDKRAKESDQGTSPRLHISF